MDRQNPRSVDFDCASSEQALMDRLDGSPVADFAALARHLAVCAACRRLHAAAGRLEHGLRLVRRPAAPAAPAGLSDRITAAVLADLRPASRWPGRARRALALAAGVLVALCLAGEQRTREIRFAEPPEPPPVSLRDRVAEAGSAVVSLTTRTADETVGQGRLLVPVVASAPPLEDPMNLNAVEPPMKSLLGAGQGVASGLEPVTSSARRAFSLFLRDAPANPETTRPGI